MLRKKFITMAAALATVVLGGLTLAQQPGTPAIPHLGQTPTQAAAAQTAALQQPTVQLRPVLVTTLAGPSATAAPTFAVITSPRGDSRVFVVEKAGRIWIIENGVRLETPFLDIRPLVTATAANINTEQGVLGLTFHPDYAQNGRFFIFYTDLIAAPGAMGLGPTLSSTPRILAEYRVSADNRNIADPASRKVLLGLPNLATLGIAPNVDSAGQTHHSGGSLGFGPDGYLYVSVGDGGWGGFNNGDIRAVLAQNPNLLYGKLLRLDVNNVPEGRAYGIPPGNMYPEGEGVPEAFAVGFRNPFGMAFDGNLVYMGEAGELSWEEINVLNVATGVGSNFGWGIAEGAGCRVSGVAGPYGRTVTNQTCDLGGLTPPAYEFVRQGNPNPCAAIGGAVWKNPAVAALQGTYFFGDYCSGFIRSFRYVNGVATDLIDWTAMLRNGTSFGPGRVTSVGVDSEGTIWIANTTFTNKAPAGSQPPGPSIGRIWKLVPV